jgi:hypothetical protein
VSDHVLAPPMAGQEVVLLQRQVDENKHP